MIRRAVRLEPFRLNVAAAPSYFIGIAVLVSLVSALESMRFWPFAPFLWIHAVLCIALALVIRPDPYAIAMHGGFQMRWKPGKAFLIGLSIGIACIAAYLAIYWALYHTLQGSSATDANLWSVMREVFRDSTLQHGDTVTMLSAFVLLGLWAPIGEELFYRRLLYVGLRQRWTFTAAAFVSAAFFGIRHSLQLLYLLPGHSYPWLSGLAYFVWAGMFGYLFAWLYEKSRKLWVPAALHALNVLWSPVVIYIMIYR
ncbi:CPBP family intramembrane glutamic endopeptidase [Paenibacillus xylaniclasticus]|uniref:CPBP family intramembrane glutamic endopeptidase n=1 Tax=Paenibacillus xylaniclasticus TaxID=588083 RepID=UPI0013DFBC5F|nr:MULTISPECIES: CPBP family intramembrane glutamic endopeptidase [Paenibacillus]GFN32242.1 hypothetical protein PCURB6_25020 [Paenibacillus curdlanolyticus]